MKELPPVLHPVLKELIKKRLPVKQRREEMKLLDDIEQQKSKLNRADVGTCSATPPAIPVKPTPHNSVTIALAPLEPGKVRRWIVSQMAGEAVMLHQLSSDQQIMTLTQAIERLEADGYVVKSKAEVLMELSSKATKRRRTGG